MTLSKRLPLLAMSLFAGFSLMAGTAGAAAPSPDGIMGLNHNPDYVDVYYEEGPYPGSPNPGDLSKMSDAFGFWKDAEATRTRVICESATYKLIGNLVKPGVDELYIGELDFLGQSGIWMEVETVDGRRYSSRLAPSKARQNTWRAGLYYYDAHLLDFKLAAEDGATAPLTAELVFHSFPDKINVQAIFHVEGPLAVKRAALVMEPSGVQIASETPLVLTSGKGAMGVIGGTMEGIMVRAEAQAGDWKKGDSPQAWLAIVPGSAEALGPLGLRLEAEAQPLAPAAFKVEGAVYAGYNAARGLYVIQQTPGAGARGGFEGFWTTPNNYLKASIQVTNDGLARRVYVVHESPSGPIEAAVLTDPSGFPLPVPVEAAKNFGGENEEPDDSAFSESYFPLDLAINETRDFRSLHLHQNWGDHALRQLSSIRFFQIYYHLSQGVTETTCFSLPTKFDTIPSGETRAYTLADYRPLSGQTWPSSPQHHHVALQGWLQYRDGDGLWQWPRYTGSTLFSVGPNLAWFVQKFESSDGKVDQRLEFLEMPQNDESRTFARIRYDFKEALTIGGKVSQNLRLLNKGSYIRKVHGKTLAWLDPDGTVKTSPMRQDSQWAAEGVPIRAYNSFFCQYPHIDGNDALVLRSVRGMVNGKPFDRLGFSAVGHPDGTSEMMLVPLIDGNTIDAGSWLEIDCILLPYGDDFSDWQVPWEESVRFGLNAKELQAQFGVGGQVAEGEPEAPAPESIQESEPPEVVAVRAASKDRNAAWGLDVEVNHGQHVLNLPPMVRAQDNWADFTIRGGHNILSVVVTGFKAPKLPMFWSGRSFLDAQVQGGDGYQVFEDADGTYGFVFTPRTRTTRGNDRWGTTTRQFYATQAISEGEITRVRAINGEVELTVEGEGETVIDSPCIWMPAVNQVQGGRPINTARGTAASLRTIPVDVRTRGTASVAVQTYGSDQFTMAVDCPAAAEIVCEGMLPGGVYEVALDSATGPAQTLTADRAGRVRVELPAGTKAALTGKMTQRP